MPLPRPVSLPLLRTGMAISLAGGFLAAAPALAVEELPRSLARVSPADFADGVQVVDDSLEPELVLTTHDTYARGRALDGARANDVHLLAAIDRASGAVTYRVVHDITYFAPRRSFTHVQYVDGQTLRDSPVTVVEGGSDFCNRDTAIGECRVFQTISFELTQAEMERVAAAYAEGSRQPWQLRFKEEQGQDVTGGIAPAEAGGLLRAVERLRDAG